MPEGLQLLAPGWLWLLLPVLVLLWMLWRRPGGRGPWTQVVDPRLQPLLLGTGPGRRQTWVIGLLALAWVLGVLALANPAWERRPQPLLADGASRVVVLELSRSMFADDVRPSRLVRARLKVEDLIDSESTAQTGLVAYAGDAFTVTPLTRDADTLRALLRVLEPGIMPVQGSRLDLALAQAHRLLDQSGIGAGEIIVIADGADAAALTEAKELQGAGHRVSVLGVGAPGVATGNRAPAIDMTALQDVAEAGGGRFAMLSADGADIRGLLSRTTFGSVDAIDDDAKAEAWYGRGPLLALLLLPVAALAFRRGWLMVSAAIAVMYLPMPPVHASAWDDLWLRPDQQAARALADGDYSRAAEAATDPLLRGAAAYRQGDFQAALAAYRDSPGAEGAYNQGNALSMLGQYRAAIEAYDRALALEPTMEDARFNRGIVAGLLAQRDRPATDTERPQTQATTQTESSQPEAGQQSADADDASDSGESEDSSPSDESADGGQVAAQSETAQSDAETGEQEEGQSAESSSSDSAGGDPSDEGSDTASMAGDERSGGDQSSSESAEGSGDGDATAPGSVADASAGQRGIDAGDQVTQGGEQDDTGDGLTADITADQPGQEDSASDREEPDARPSPDSAGEAGRMASADTERSGATDDDRALQESATVDRNEAGQGQPGGGQDNEVGRSFAEAAQRLAERQGEGPDGEGDLIEPDASTGAAGPAAQAPRGPGAGDDSLDGRSPAAASDWSEEERLAAEQWLRRIPDDPGGLLRRKFLYQYRERQQAVGGTPPARR